MSYNGIGLSTVRGSGTNGYVQKNKSFLPKWREKPPADLSRGMPLTAPSMLSREPNPAILEHEAKRAVEIRCLALQEQLEEDGEPDDEVEKKVQELREKLLKEMAEKKDADKWKGEDGQRRQFKPSDTHGISEAKRAQNAAFASVLGIAADYEEGKSFDPVWQAQKAAEREAEREKEK
ncbi:cwf21 domain-containing protein, partial [Hyaloraphidium curvatum]